jgi:small subunit ribosomal protein S4
MLIRDKPDYIDVDHAKVTRVPTRSEVLSPVMMEPHLVVEYYSR